MTARSDFIEEITAPLRQCFADLGLDPVLAQVVPAARPDLADFQCNGAMAGAKVLKCAPREIAQKVVDALQGDARFAEVSLAGPGFINFRLADAFLAERAQRLVGDVRCGVPERDAPQRVVVDYAGPNVAKPMHVGHLRASIIGESIKRLFRFCGDQVWGDAHFGDWGFQMGLLIEALREEMPGLPYHDEQSQGPYPSDSPVTLEDLSRLYPQAAARAKTDEAFRERARRATRELQQGRAGYRALWQHFVTVSREALKRDFAALGVEFDLWNGESDADAYVPEMVEALKDNGLAVPDQGALVIHVARDEDKKAPPPLLLVSSEGSAMYGTTDLATILQRRRELDFDLCLYCVDQRQAEHFRQVFRAAVQAGYAEENQLEHLPNGTMNGPDGKPFKTREGGVLRLGDLIDMTQSRAQARLEEAGLGQSLSPEAYQDTAQQVAVAAIKFADLMNHRTTSYVFDLDRFTSFEGKTGPYLLYQAVRIKSLLRRAEQEGVSAGELQVADASERALVLTLDALARTCEDARTRRAPNVLAEQAYRLAQAYARFYAACPVFSVEPALQASRLQLSVLCLQQIELLLSLLGIDVPERM